MPLELLEPLSRLLPLLPELCESRFELDEPLCEPDDEPEEPLMPPLCEEPDEPLMPPREAELPRPSSFWLPRSVRLPDEPDEPVDELWSPWLLEPL